MNLFKKSFSVILILSLVLVIFGTLFSANIAKAEVTQNFTVSDGEGCNFIGTVSINKTNYSTNETIVASGMGSASCNGGGSISNYGIRASQDGGATWQDIYCLSGCGSGSTNFITPNWGGTGTIHFEESLTTQFPNYGTTIGVSSISYTVSSSGGGGSTAVPPTIINPTVIFVTSTAAGLQANITSAGMINGTTSATITERGFCYFKQSQSPSSAICVIASGTTTGTFTMTPAVSTLIPNTPYHWYGYAKNSAGLQANAWSTFTTQGYPLTNIDVSGTHQVGQVVTATNLLPVGAVGNVDYQWQFLDCVDTSNGQDPCVDTWVDISGKTLATYTIESAYLGFNIQVQATGKNGYTGIVVSGPQLVTASMPTTYTVTATAGANGTITPASRTVNSGSTTTFTVTPNSGYTSSVGGTCGGTLVGTTYTTNPITANCTVVATFTNIGAVPTVTSPTCTNLTPTSLTAGANVTSLGTPASISARGTCVSTGAPSNCVAASGTTTGIYTHSRTSLSPSTTYYIYGYADNATGRGYSVNTPCTTPSSPTGSISATNCTISTGSGSCNSTLNWNTINPLGGVTSAVTSPYPAVNTIILPAGNDGTNVSVLVPYSSRSFFLYHNAVLLSTATPSATCNIATDHWDALSSKCLSNTPTQYTLSITKNGTGTGTIGAIPTGIACGVTCSAPYSSGTIVSLSATPTAGSFFRGWTGDCSSSTTPFQITMNAAKSCTATFTLIPTGTLNAPDCTIATGGSTCPTNLSWATTNPIPLITSEVTTNLPVANTSVATANTSTKSYVINYGNQNFYLYHFGYELASDLAKADCNLAIDHWNGSKCVTNSSTLPTVITQTGPIDGTNKSATFGGKVSDDGGSAVTARGIVWGTTGNPTVTTNVGKTTDGTGLGDFSSFMSVSSNLIQDYHVRAYATNSAGTSYGLEIQFAPVVTSPTVGAITSTSAKLGSTVDSFGVTSPLTTPSISSRGTCYYSTANPTPTCLVEGGTTLGAFSHLRTGLIPSTTYHYYGYAKNVVGPSQIIESTFTTPAAAVPTATFSASNCDIPLNGTTCSSTLNWNITNPIALATTAITTPVSITIPGTSATSGTQTYPVSIGPGTRDFYLYHNGFQLGTTQTATANCIATTEWNGSNCVTIVVDLCPLDPGIQTTLPCSVVGGSDSLTGSDCKIQLNQSTCSTTLTPYIANPVGGAPTNITKNVPAPNTLVSTILSLPTTVSAQVSYPSTTFFLNHNSNTLAQTTINADCDTGMVMSGGVCIVWGGVDNDGHWSDWGPCINCSGINGTKYRTCDGQTGNGATCVPDPDGYSKSCDTCPVGGGLITMDFKANPASIIKGKSTTLSWSSNADSCVGVNFTTIDTSPNGSATVKPITNTTYELKCTKSGVDDQPPFTTKVKVIKVTIIEG
jgi:hypothetical protein